MSDAYVYVILVGIMWIITVNLIRRYLQSIIRSDDGYSYYIEFKLLAYNDGKIYGESRRHERYTLIDDTKLWESFVLSNIGRWAQIDYDVTYRGHVFISVESTIKNIRIIET